jgi:uncharacterized protein YukE
MADLDSGLGQLAHAFAELEERWAQVQTNWQDDAARRFEAQHLAPIPAQLKLLVAAAQNLKATITEATQELDDRDTEDGNL